MTEDADAYSLTVTLRPPSASRPTSGCAGADNAPLAGLADNFFHLRPGETRELVVEKAEDLQTAAALRGLLLLRTL